MTLRSASLSAWALLLGACAGAPQVPETSAPAPLPPSLPYIPAVPPEEHPFSACREAHEDEVAVLDETRARLHETVCAASLWFDGLFGEGDLLAARSAHGRFELIGSHSEFEGDDVRVRFNAHVKLPALRNRLHLFVGRDDEDDVARDRAEGQALRSQFGRADAIEDWFAGLGYRLEEFYGVRTDFQVGARSLSQPTVFARMRASYTAFEDEDDLVSLRATPFVNNRDRFGLTVSGDFDHTLSLTRLVRWGTVGTITQESSGVEWRSALILFQSLQNRRALAWEAFVRGATAAPEPLTEYGARQIYRQPLARARLFLEFIVGYSWPRTDPALSREGSFGTSLGLELPFGYER